LAIIDKSKKPYVQDENTSVKIGLDLPIQLAVSGSDGYFSSTSTTIEAVKNNIKNLLKTTKGERLMQPTLGLNLKKYLFEQFTNDLKDTITNDILETFKFWLPFVNVTNIEINMDDSSMRNKMNININFNIVKDPNTLESVTIEIGE
tara:strand:+ start:625 stop:1065 length:441 start_codon:yes stop_codon:yes gene_type:complete